MRKERIEYLTRFFAGVQKYEVSGRGAGGLSSDDVAMAMVGLSPLDTNLGICFASRGGTEDNRYFIDFMREYCDELKSQAKLEQWPSPHNVDYSGDLFEVLGMVASYRLLFAERCPRCKGRGYKQNLKVCDRCSGTGHKKVTSEFLRKLTPFSRYEWGSKYAGADNKSWFQRITDLENDLASRLQNISEHLHRKLKGAREDDKP